MNSKLTPPLIAISFAGVLLSSSLQAAVSYGTAGASYTQNFDSLSNTALAQPAWSNNTTLAGWYWADPDGGTASTYTVVTRAGSDGGLANQQDRPLSIGSYTVPDDRAFGTQSRTSATDTTANFARYGLQLTNNTGATLSEFTLTFTAEQWRTINNQPVDKLTFDYQVFSSGSGNQIGSNTGWTNVAAFTFNTPITTTTGSRWLDGNAAANRQVFTGTITGLNWDAGADLWLRWNDVSVTHAVMGIDDISFAAVAAIPEPSSVALLMGLSACAMLVTRRRRS